MTAATSGVWVSALVFATAACAVWWGGSALAARADLITERTGLGRVFAGAVLLGTATSLPEIATSVSAAYGGAGALAGNNLLGGVAMQVAVLAVVDMTALRGRALTSFAPHASLLLHGVFLALVLAVATAAIVGPDFVLGGSVSVWSIALAVLYVVTLYSLRRYEGAPRWEPCGAGADTPRSAIDLKDAIAKKHEDATLARIGFQFAVYAGVVVVGGYIVATTGERLAEQTGLGQTLVGATLVAISTSLPEVSTTYNAVKLGAYRMAVSNILGTNALELALFLPADVAYANGSIFATLGPASALLAVLGILVSLIYLWGVLERADRTVGNLGIDSAFVLITYVLGMAMFSALS